MRIDVYRSTGVFTIHRRAATLATGLAGAMVGYAAGLEANDLVPERKTVNLLKLPKAFDGFRIVLLTDLHLHPFTSANLIRRTVKSPIP